VHRWCRTEYIKKLVKACCIECHAVREADRLLQPRYNQTGKCDKGCDLPDRDQVIPE
jgi:hypothetical protein